MLYCKQLHFGRVTPYQEVIYVNNQLEDFYKLPNIREYEDLCLQSLSEQCAAYEEKVYGMMSRLSQRDKEVLETYITLRNDLEAETFKVALRWGKMHYK